MIGLNFVFIMAGLAFCIMYFKLHDNTASYDYTLIGLVIGCTVLNGVVALKYFNLL